MSASNTYGAVLTVRWLRLQRGRWVWLTLLPFALTRTFCGFQVGTWWEGKVDDLTIKMEHHLKDGWKLLNQILGVFVIEHGIDAVDLVKAVIGAGAGEQSVSQKVGDSVGAVEGHGLG